MLPTYKRRACRVIVDPIGTGATPGDVNNAGIWPELCIALYCTGATLSNPGGGMSQYFDGFLRREIFGIPASRLESSRVDERRGERERERDVRSLRRFDDDDV